MSRSLFPMIAVVAFVLVSSADAGDWMRFRGPNGSGVSEDQKSIPTTWGPIENLKWKVALPGNGQSCPIVIGDKVFVTCWSGYGMSQEDPGTQEQLRERLREPGPNALLTAGEAAAGAAVDSVGPLLRAI